MSLLEIKNLTFTYPDRDQPALRNIDLSFDTGEFVLLTGPSGCGKTTLLRQMKKALIPYGRSEGSVTFHGVPISRVRDREAAGQIGYVFQDPENQIVTDRVWHELAFGLENLGFPKDAMERRIAEVSNYFGIASWMERETSDLSGGEKQILNLASVLAMEPKVLLLDEPTSQLDPIASARLYDMLHHIHAELGLTILLSEHRIESLYAMADQVVRMEDGRILAQGRPEELARSCREDSLDFPSATRIWAGVKITGSSTMPPLSTRQGRAFLRTLTSEERQTSGSDNNNDPNVPNVPDVPDVPLREMGPAESFPLERKQAVEKKHLTSKRAKQDRPVLQARGLYFSYPNSPVELLRGSSLSLSSGQIYAIVGGNGSGKTTLLRLLSGLLPPSQGKYFCFEKRIRSIRDIKRGSKGLVLLPQDPKALFHGITVEEELREMLPVPGSEEEADRYQKKIQALLSSLGLFEHSEAHPYDLSGGEAERLALGKLLLLDPRLLLLDEPTKGLDPWNKEMLGSLLRDQASKGKSILLVTHDLSFAAHYADCVSLLFDGRLTPSEKPRDFFLRNHFYTTAPARMSADCPFQGITVEEVVENIKAQRKGWTP